MNGHDAPISLSPTSMSRPEEGLQHHQVEYSIEDARTPQAPNSNPQYNVFRRESMPNWSTHPRNISGAQESRRGSLAQDSTFRRESSSWDPSRRDSNPQANHTSMLHRPNTNTLSLLSENELPRDTVSPAPFHGSELESQPINGSKKSKESVSVEVSETSLQTSWWDRPYLRWANPYREHWRYILPILTFMLLAILIALIVLYLHKKTPALPADSEPTITDTQQMSALPLIDSALSAISLFYSTYFALPTTSSQTTKLAYTTSNNSICIRTYSGVWISPLQCISNLSPAPKPRTPLALLDWFGGPSIYYISTTNHIVGLDAVPENNTFKPSTINFQIPPVEAHPESQLTAVTWLNGTSAWLYYQDVNGQLREYGLDDYRDTTWQFGALGPLGLAQAGSGIGAARYLLKGSEVLEVFIQTDNDAIHGRVYMDSVWEADFYSVDGTTTDLSSNAALTATTISQKNGDDEILLAWVSSSGSLNIQSRGTVNVSAYNAFTAPKQLVEGDGGVQPGLAATGDGEPTIYFANGQKILEVLAVDVLAANWTTVDVTSI